jgi:hypothetical protein
VLLVVSVVSCVSPPIATEPVTIGGLVVAAGAEARYGTPIAGASLGPLALRDGIVRRVGNEYRWAVSVNNANPTEFGVTLVIRLLGDGEEIAGSDSVAFEIGRNATWRGEGVVQLSAQAPVPESWRVDVWVRLLPTPDRRTLRGN